jgi:phage shock protein PspC (stress-responsive transcriptional regulator)
MTFPGDLIAWVYFLLVPVVAVFTMRLTRTQMAKDFGDVEDVDHILVVVIGIVGGLLWPGVVAGYILWRIAFPPKQPVEDEVIEDE